MVDFTLSKSTRERMDPLSFKKALNLEQIYLIEEFESFTNLDSKDLSIALVHGLAQSHMAQIHQFSLDQLADAERNHKYTPLHLSVMMQDLEILNFLLDKVENLVPVDRYNWTPLHYAYLTQNKALIQLLEDKQSERNQNQPINIPLPCKEIKEILTYTPLPDHQSVFHYQDPETKEIFRNATASKFKQLTGAVFTNSVIVSPQALLAATHGLHTDPDLEKNKQISPLLKESIKNNYPTYLSSLPKIYLGKDSVDGWGVFALDQITRGSLVVHYAGRLVLDHTSSKYLAGDVDGEKEGNLAARVNDGYPNTRAVAIRLNKIVTTYIFIALRDIAPHEEILADYQFGHSVKMLKGYVNAAQEELIRVLEEEGGIKWIFNRLRNTEIHKLSSLEEVLNYEKLHATLKYLFNTPSVMLNLILEGHISLSDIATLTNFFNLTDLHNFTGIMGHPQLLLFVEAFKSQDQQDLIEKLQRLDYEDEPLHKKALQFVLLLGRTYSVLPRLFIHRYLVTLDFFSPATWSQENLEAYKHYAELIEIVEFISNSIDLSLDQMKEQIQNLAENLPKFLKELVIKEYLNALSRQEKEQDE